MRKKALVTGCTGLVGHGICLTLLEQGYEVCGTSRGQIKSCHPRLNILNLDLVNEQSFSAIKSILQEVDIVIHNAAKLQDKESKWEDYYKVNLLATRMLLDAASEFGIKHFIYISGTGLLDNSFGVIDENTPFLPRNDYTASKAAAEIIAMQSDAEGKNKVGIIRFPAPYGYRGKSDAVLPLFIKKTRAGEDIVLMGSGNRQQIFTFVEDIGSACIKAINKEARGTFHIAGPETVTMKQLAETILKVFPGTGSKIVYDSRMDPQENKPVNISIDKARTHLDYTPEFSLEGGLSKIANKSFLKIFDE